MWFFKKRISLQASGIFQGFTDWHSHILPGVDDGVQTLDESLRLLAKYEELGIQEVWLTPHIMEDIPNTTGHLRACFANLQSAYTGKITLRLAAENMLDSLFEERLAKNDLLPLGNDGRHLLVETSYFNPPMGLQNILLRIKAKGYYPVLAHPERYMYMDKAYYAKLKNMGIRFQLNLFSLAGAYGKEVTRKALWLLRHGMYDCAGTDIHQYASGLEHIARCVITRPVLRKLEKFPFKPCHFTKIILTFVTSIIG